MSWNKPSYMHGAVFSAEGAWTDYLHGECEINCHTFIQRASAESLHLHIAFSIQPVRNRPSVFWQTRSHLEIHSLSFSKIRDTWNDQDGFSCLVCNVVWGQRWRTERCWEGETSLNSETNSAGTLCFYTKFESHLSLVSLFPLWCSLASTEGARPN